ncbi:MAG: (2Fe-2S)-binding protein [Sedimentisphaerales bacterium]|nr:(2Fe-2S)-binding protein [Sedimentisphaerales bacterium]MBN2844151.1 (2Fe-2S)-binding protein [Sedimentisphaerales bacterium]
MDNNTITIHIDGKPVETKTGSTILEAARQADIDIPSLCYNAKCQPGSSCMVCLVKVHGRNGFSPSCATQVTHGMKIDSQTEEIAHLRRKALELLLSEHLGDCLGPCQIACPADMNIPAMLRAVNNGDMAKAAQIVLANIPLPAILGRICPAPCEKICRHKQVGSPIAICKIKGQVGEFILSNPIPGNIHATSGHKVAVIGAGPAGLTASWYLHKDGCEVTIFEKEQIPGGGLLQIPQEILPPSLRDAEISAVLEGIKLCQGTIGPDLTITELSQKYDAVVLATGPGSDTLLDECRNKETRAGDRDIKIDPNSGYLTGNKKLANIFIAGGINQTGKMAVRAVASGHKAAIAIRQLLTGQPVTGAAKPFNVRIGKFSEQELEKIVELRNSLNDNDRHKHNNAKEPGQAGDCLGCDCRAADTCRLRQQCAALGAKPESYRLAQRKNYNIELTQNNGLIYEPGKCIKCGLCLQISAQDPQKALSFTGRGYETRVVAPLGMTLNDLSVEIAQEIVAICPTGAMSLKTGHSY